MDQEPVLLLIHVMPVVHRTYPWQVAPQQSLLPFGPDAQVYATT